MSFCGGTRRWAQPMKSIIKSRDGPKRADDSYGIITEDFQDSSTALNTQQLRLFVGTWNVGGRAPTPGTRDSVQEWLEPNQPSDIYVLGFQEIVPLTTSNILRGNKEDGTNGGTLTIDMWEALISETLNQSTTQTQSMNACCNNKRTISIPTSMRMHAMSTLTTKETQSSYVRDNNNDSDKNDLESLLSDEDTIYSLTPSIRLLSKSGLEDNEAIPNASMYIRIARKQMVGLFISIWARWNLQQHIKNVQVSSVGCGIMNRLGNKGSVSISLVVHETSFCFICGHFRSGQKSDDVIRRNADVENILQRTKFSCCEKLHHNPSFELPSSILAHDRIILLGDLNYRLNIASSELKALLLREDWKTLFEKDELKDAKGAGGVLEGWQEGSISFAPTYKYLINSDTYYWMAKDKEGTNKRAPAWCDRILWHGKGLKQLSYTRCESKHSDHRPVRSTFIVEVETLEKASIVDASHEENQQFTPFLEEVKELLCTTKFLVKRLSLQGKGAILETPKLSIVNLKL